MTTSLVDPRAAYVLRHPLTFTRNVVTGFSRNQGLLLAGAVAYNALLSLVPSLILAVILLSHVVPRDDLLATLARYLEWLVPSQSKALLVDVSNFLDSGINAGIVLFVVMLFFGSLAFSALEKAMAVIFAHRRLAYHRHAVVTVLLPYVFMFALAVAFLVVTAFTVAAQFVARESLYLFGIEWSLAGASGFLLYLLGMAVEVAIFAAIYLVLPVGPTRRSHALVGAVAAALLWDAIRHLLVWYLSHLSKASVVYGSLTTAVLALFSMEIGAALLLFGAQVIAEYERIDVSKG